MTISMPVLLIACLLAVVGLVAVLLFFWAAKCELAHERTQRLTEAAKLSEQVAQLRRDVLRLTEEVARPEQPPAVAVPTGGVPPSFNLNKRSQALRMHRRGESSDKIAAFLQIPKGEVDLLIKITDTFFRTPA